MRFKKDKVRIDAIDLNDKLYLITTNKCTKALADSIKNIGLLHPPLLIQKKSTYCIISGFRRVFALKALGFSDLEARIIKDPTDDREIIKIAISENTLQRSLNVVEKARSLKLLSNYISDVNELTVTAKSVGVPCDKALLIKLLRICELTDSIQEGLIDGFISMPVALMLDEYDHSTSNLFVEVFKILHLGLNRQREFISLITEIAFRDDIEPDQIMKEIYFTEVLNDENLDRNQKTQELRKCLKHIRFPEISKAEATFRRNVKDLNIAKGIKLIPPNHFEGSEYMFQLTFNSLKKIESIKSHLDRIVKDPKFERILNR